MQDQGMTQDELYGLLKAYMHQKGVMSESEVKRKGWDHEHERVYKEFCQFGLGVVPPVMVPTSEDTLPLQIIEDDVWMEMLGMSPLVIGHDDEEDFDTGEIKSDPGSPDPSKIKVAENGDLSFVMKTGIHQERPPTEVETLSTNVQKSTDEVSQELSTGEAVTKEGMTEAAKSEDDEGTSDNTTPNVDVYVDSVEEAESEEDLDDDMSI